jgi:hypothetical protein
VLIPANPFSASYLEVKRLRMQHELPEPAAAVVDTTGKGRRAAQ